MLDRLRTHVILRVGRGMIRALLCGCAGLGLLGAGCRSASQAAPAERSAAQAPARFSRSGTTLLHEAWWQSLGDPALTMLIETALDENFSLRATWQRLAQAEAVARRTGAERQPTLDLTAGASRTRTRIERENERTTRYDVGLLASFELDLWGRVASERAAALLDAEASAADVQVAALTLSAAVANVWYELAEERAQGRLLSEQTATNQQLLALVEERFRQGQVQAADVLRQRQLVEQSHGREVLSSGRAELLEHELSVLVGRSPGTLPAEPTPLLVELPPLPDTGVPAELLARRPDVMRAERLAEAADARLAVARADRYPRFALTGRLSTGGDHVQRLLRDWLAEIAGSLLAPIYAGGALAAEVERTSAATIEALESYGEVVLDALREVEDALAAGGAQAQYFESLSQQLDLAEAVIERTRASYVAGQFDYLRVLEAVTARQALEREHLSARRERLALRIQLCRALAGPVPLEPPDPRPPPARGSGTLQKAMP